MQTKKFGKKTDAKELPDDPDTAIVMVCNIGKSSKFTTLYLKSLGYREVLAHLRGESSLEEAREIMKMNTRRYAKRQLTWFRGDTRIEWLKADTDETDASRAKHIVSSLDKKEPRKNQTQS